MEDFSCRTIGGDLHDAAVIAAGEQSPAGPRRDEDRAVLMQRDARLAVGIEPQHRAVAERKSRDAAKKGGGRDMRTGSDRPDVRSEGGGGFCHSVDEKATLRMPRLCGAGQKALPDLFFFQMTADEHDTAQARLGRLPVALQIAVEHHMDALEDEALRLVLEGEDAL